MPFVDYNPGQALTNQFVMTYGPKGSGKSTFGLTVGATSGRKLLVIDLDRRSYSARKTAMETYGAQIAEIPELRVSPGDGRTMDEILGKKAITKKGKSGGSYDVWVLDKKAALDIKQMIEGGLEEAKNDPSIGGVFIDNGKVLGSVWASAWSEDGRISSIPKMAWGEVYGPLRSTFETMTRTDGCTKDILLAHHIGDQYLNDEKTGRSEPKWVDRLLELADVVLEHYVNPRTFQLGVRFEHKLPADNSGFYGCALERTNEEGCELFMQYDVVKAVLLGEAEAPEGAFIPGA